MQAASAVLADKAADDMLAEAGIERPADGTPMYASQYAFKKIIASVLADPGNPRHIVFFVHGFNNALADAV